MNENRRTGVTQRRPERDVYPKRIVLKRSKTVWCSDVGRIILYMDPTHLFLMSGGTPPGHLSS